MTTHDLKREEFWLTSKLWNNAHKSEDVLLALKQSLQDLKTDYLDLYLIHWPVVFKPKVKGVPQNLSDYLTLEEVPIIETWNTMVEAKEKGLIKHIGVSNFSLEKLKDLVQKTNYKPEMLQVESHPFLPQKELLEYCKDNGIHFTAYSPLGRGKTGTANNPSLFEDDTVLKMARKYNCTLGQILIAWGLERGTSVIPKSANSKHIESNFESQKIRLDPVDVDKLGTLATRHRFGWGKSFLLPGSPYDNVFDE